MTNLFIYLVELNISLLILFVAYKLFFDRDKNFVVRRIYLMGVIALPFILPLLPDSIRMPMSGTAPISITLEEITVFGQGSAQQSKGPISIGNILAVIYVLILGAGIFKILFQFTGIFRAILRSPRINASGTTLLSNANFHASSFFGFIFVDPDSINEDSFDHILQHENIHKREWHSIDRILVEIFVMINWFNPVAWMFRRSVIQNLEYLADSAVVGRGTDPAQYQLSILNQYIGSASITNQFSSQIKNRIKMLNKDYKMGSKWKLAMIFPLVSVAILIASCTEKDASGLAADSGIKTTAVDDSKIYNQVEVMPTFQGGEPIEFRKFIAQNLIYPVGAKESGATGKIFVKFVVRKDGRVEIPTVKELAKLEGVPLDEVVVVAYRPVNDKAAAPDENLIELLKKEATRVVLSSPDWEPGLVGGKAVDVAYTFPIKFILQ